MLQNYKARFIISNQNFYKNYQNLKFYLENGEFLRYKERNIFQFPGSVLYSLLQTISMLTIFLSFKDTITF